LRPKKTRWVKCAPGERCFKPLCKPLSKLDIVSLTLDEFEALRLADLDGLKQVDAAKRLKISRPTFSRIVASARNKIADGLVNIKAIRIEGGCCKVIRRKAR
jgi:Predicted DNA-binding proteins